MSNFRNDNRRKGNSITKSLKDYAVPLIGLVIILAIAFNMFSGGSKNNTTNTGSTIQDENKQGLTISLGALADAEIVYLEGKKVKIDDTNSTLYKGEAIHVKEGSAMLEHTAGSINIDKLGEVLYDENGNIKLNNNTTNVWINSTNKMDLKLAFANVFLGENSTISINQNESYNSIYLLSGNAEVELNSGKRTSLAKGQKLAISQTDTTSSEVNLETKKEPIGSDFKSTEWYTKNGGDLILNTIETSTGETTDSTESGSLESIKNTGSEFITIDNPTGDEAFSDTQTIEIDGTFLEGVTEITINGISAKLNQETKKFTLKNFSLDKKTNDVIFKVYNENKEILGKYVKTIYYNGGVDEKANTSGFEVKNFSVDASDFKFTSPSSDGIYTTYEDAVSIYGETPKNTVKKVSVNGYNLKTFNGTNWRYHAKKDYENLKEGTNVYEIKYYGDNNKLIYTNNFTIIKKVSPVKTIKK